METSIRPVKNDNGFLLPEVVVSIALTLLSQVLLIVFVGNEG